MESLVRIVSGGSQLSVLCLLWAMGLSPLLCAARRVWERTTSRVLGCHLKAQKLYLVFERRFGPARETSTIACHYEVKTKDRENA